MSSRAGSRRSTISTDYCYHVASVVGLCCLHIWGYRSEGGKAERLAESCGIALQLTNIIRDVGEDARNGRIYLPEEDLERYGVCRSRASGTRAIVAENPRACWPLRVIVPMRYYQDAGALVSARRPGRPSRAQDDRRNLSGAAR